LQEKIYEKSGNYRLVTYSEMKINEPLKPDALKLKLPSGVKTEYPQK
jgi:outer membrane lipoprotein-sorting protein